MNAEAEARARALLADAEAAAGRVLEEARDLGRREGWARAAATLAGAAAERDRILAAVEGEVVALALDVARKVLGRHVAGFPEAIVDLAARGLAEARERREVRVRVHPSDAAALRAAEGELAARLVRASLDLREDPSVSPGVVLVETESGRIEAGIETQLAELSRALAEETA